MRTHKHTSVRTALVAVTASLGLVLAACGGDDTDPAGDTTDTETGGAAETDAAADDGDGEDAADGGGGTITLGYIPSWTDGLSTAHLIDTVLTEAGYTVEHQEISEPGILYTALAEGDVDLYPSAWPEVTHASYMEEYGDRIEDVGTYYDGAKLTMAVPEYTDIDSIADLADNVDMFDGQIVGIEAGAGLTEAVQDSVIPTYGLDDAGFTLSTSSTTAMLAELESATMAEEDIVVTLWRPFWANAEYPVKDLEDPEGALGEAEGLHFLGRSGFSEDFPEVAEWLGSLSLDDEQYGALEDTVVNEFEDDPGAGAEAFLEEHSDVVGSVG